MKTMVFFFGWAYKFTIGGKTDQGINCLPPWEKINN